MDKFYSPILCYDTNTPLFKLQSTVFTHGTKYSNHSNYESQAIANRHEVSDFPLLKVVFERQLQQGRRENKFTWNRSEGVVLPIPLSSLTLHILFPSVPGKSNKRTLYTLHEVRYRKKTNISLNVLSMMVRKVIPRKECMRTKMKILLK